MKVTIELETDKTAAEVEVERVARLLAETQPAWSKQLLQVTAELARYRMVFNAATIIQGDDEVLKYITSGNSIPVTRCTVSADLIRQLLDRAKTAELE